mmetsp:Transcript_41349/g.118500  ORF Transcript_41349/g.118500 Transcript_41349/m.118500 type:complete len:107 (-) Transcript_41349:455-775(-)
MLGLISIAHGLTAVVNAGASGACLSRAPPDLYEPSKHLSSTTSTMKTLLATPTAENLAREARDLRQHNGNSTDTVSKIIDALRPAIAVGSPTGARIRDRQSPRIME